jgi:Carboxypeptidase regulatory-like domain
MKGTRAVVFIAVFLLAVPLSFAQINTGRILGTVHDQTGGVIPNTTVIITEVQTNTSHTLTTNDAGEYLLPGLPPGLYKVRAFTQSFQTVEHAGIQLEVGKDAVIDFLLKPGQVTEVVEVSGGAPIVETTNDVLGGTLSNKEIIDLPLNGRDYENLVVLRPGVQRTPGGGFLSSSSNGLRPEDLNYVVDGIDNNDPFYGVSVINQVGISGAPATAMPIDALQEFNVQENSQADSGYKPGAVISLGLKSGTNEIHGTVYDFERNSYFDARNYFNPVGGEQRPLHFHQFGGTIGGPIVKEKLFYFVAYQGQRSLIGNSFPVQAPLTAPAGGDTSNSVPDAEADLATHGIGLSPVSANLLKLYPANTTGSTTLPLGFPSTMRQDNGLAKVDYHINDRHTLTGRWFVGNSDQVEQFSPKISAQFLDTAENQGNVGGGTWTFVINPRMVNQLTFGYTRFAQGIVHVDANVDPLKYGINTGVKDPVNFGLPTVTISGFTALGGSGFDPLITRPNQNYQLVETFSYLLGRHALKFGGEFRRSSTNDLNDRTGQGSIRFIGGLAIAPTLDGSGNPIPGTGSTPLEDFLAGAPSSGQLFVGVQHRLLSTRSFYGFLLDTYRVSPRLTLNLGLRYELNTPPTEDNNQIANFVPSVGLVQAGQVPTIFHTDRNNFAPRVGIAWDVFGNGKTIIRAGGGLEYEYIPLAVFLSNGGPVNAATPGIGAIPTGAFGVNPSAGGLEKGTGTIAVGAVSFTSSQLNYTSAGPVFGNPVLNCDPNLVIGGTPGNPCSIMGINPDFRTPYVENWNLNVEHAIANNFSLQVGYVGNHAVKLIGPIDLNQPDLVTQTRPYTSQFPFLGVINQINNLYGSNYNSLQVTATLKPFHGLSFLSGYTWSHALGSGDQQRTALPQDSRNPKGEYSNLDFDIRHRFTFAMSYALPAPRKAFHLLDGWQINSIVTLQSGSPYSANDSGDDISGTAEFTDRWSFFGKHSDFRERRDTPLPFFPGTSNAACVAQATAIGALATLGQFGCFAVGSSVLIPPAPGTFGNTRPNIFPGLPFKDWDFSLVKNIPIKGERLRAQFRAEFFNVLNHPNFASLAYASGNTFNGDVTSGVYGCACATPDSIQGNPVIGSGGARAIQLSLKLIW